MRTDDRVVPASALLVGYVTTLVAFVILDAGWLMFFAIDAFKQSVGSILRDRPDVGAAVAFYCIYAGGLVMLAVRPASMQQSYRKAVAGGALVGLPAYATFDLTNLSVISGWPAMLALADMAWGTAASAVAALAGYAATSRWSTQSPMHDRQGAP